MCDALLNRVLVAAVLAMTCVTQVIAQENLDDKIEPANRLKNGYFLQ